MKADITRFELLDYAGSEAINALCTNLSFTGKDKKIIMVTSCQASEGKSFLSMNIMRTLTQLGKQVVLVDADLRRSVINTQFGIRLPQGAMGLAHHLAGMCAVEDILYDTNYSGAYFVPVGRTVTNSLALLNTPMLGRLLKLISTNVDYVLVDSAPIGAIIDAAEIAKSCDGALVVVTYNQVSRRELAEARQQIEMAGCQVLGAVLNSVDPNTIGGRKYYYYKQHYGAHGVYTDQKARPIPSTSSVLGKRKKTK